MKATFVAACGLALVACSSGGEVAAPTTPAPTTASPITTAAPTTTAASTTTSASIAPTTTVAPTTTTVDLSAFARNKVVVADRGDGTGTITPEYLTGSHAQLDNATLPAGQRNPDGTLFYASNPAFDQTWLLSMNTTDLAVVRPSKGWKFTRLSFDAQWTPNACGGVYHVLLGKRFEVLSDAAPLLPADPSAANPDAQIYHGRLTVFDLSTRKFFDILPWPNDHTYFFPVAVDDHTLEVLYAPEPAAAPVTGPVRWTKLVRRRIDLTTFAFIDQDVALPRDFYEYATETTLGRVDLSWSEGPTDYRSARGHIVEGADGRLSLVVETTTPDFDTIIDGVRITYPEGSRTVITNAIDGSPIATFNGVVPGQIGVYGYRSRLLYLLQEVPTTGGPTGSTAPTVYDPTSGTAMPVFDYTSPAYSPGAYVGVFVVGVLPR